MRPGPLVFLAFLAAAAGWILHLVADRVGTAPYVSWTQPGAILLLALLVGATAWGTWRAVQVRHERLTPSQGLNRLVLGRASALVGAVVGGAYLGYALSWIGSLDSLAGERGWRSGVAAVAGALLVVAGLWLERACRVPEERSGS